MKRGWVIAIIVLAVLVVAGVILMNITRWGWAWTGVVEVVGPNQEYYRGKTLWDLLELLIVPAALATIAWWFSNRERKDDRAAADKRAEFDRAAADQRAQVDREVADKRAQVDREVAETRARTEHEIATNRLQEAALQGYYDKMTELLLKENLRDATEGEEVISIARSRTLATLRSLDGVRKGMLIKFLYEAQLIGAQRKIIDLNNADLNEAILSGAYLSEAYLRGVLLIKAHLEKVDLSNADLGGADLWGSFLTRANLRGANLCGADLRKIESFETDFSEATIEEAKVDYRYLVKAKSLHNAIMWDGNIYNPDIHTEIARLRKKAGLDDGNTPPEELDGKAGEGD